MCCDPLDVTAVHADFLCGTANKGLHGLPGISFVYVSPDGRARVAEVPPRTIYLHIGTYLSQQERGDVPFTPAVQICYSLDEALDELAESGGTAARIADYVQRAATIRRGIAELGLTQLLPPDRPRANAVTAIRLPAGLTYQVLHDRLKQQGYIIYAGQGGLSREVFRVATMGDLTQSTLHAFLTVLAQEIKVASPTG
jgi:2-aminoethylphosphonate-pyruvate transaminase